MSLDPSPRAVPKTSVPSAAVWVIAIPSLIASFPSDVGPLGFTLKGWGDNAHGSVLRVEPGRAVLALIDEAVVLDPPGSSPWGAHMVMTDMKLKAVRNTDLRSGLNAKDP